METTSTITSIGTRGFEFHTISSIIDDLHDQTRIRILNYYTLVLSEHARIWLNFNNLYVNKELDRFVENTCTLIRNADLFVISFDYSINANDTKSRPLGSNYAYQP